MTVTLTHTPLRQRVPLTTLEPGTVRMYTCGPTVHDIAHVGNFRTFMFEDLLRRVLSREGYRVVQVMNLTDVDDKTIRKARDAGVPLGVYTARYKEAFFTDRDTLRIQPAEHYPEATAYIDAMVDMIQALERGGHAYRAPDGSVYFDVGSYDDYGALSGQAVGQLQAGARVDSSDTGKRAPEDFALWKAWVPEDGDAVWDTALGRGRPGWHIECSAMSRALLGDRFDIHTGGIDNLFPHHENERAQSVCATHASFATLWMHSAHLILDGEKMSKSLGNTVNVRTLVAQGHKPVAIRYALLDAHYRTTLNLNDDALHAAARAVARLRDFVRRLDAAAARDADDGYEDDTTQKPVRAWLEAARAGWGEALRDDLNLPAAQSHVFTLLRDVNGALDAGAITSQDARAVADWMRNDVDSILDVLRGSDDDDEHGDAVRAQVAALVQSRETARARRDWTHADTLRASVEALGYTLRDTPEGPVWFRA